MADTRTRNIILRAAVLTEDKEAQTRLEQDKYGTWQRMASRLSAGADLHQAAIAKGMTEADLDEYLAKFLAMLALASLNPETALTVTSKLLAMLEEAEMAKVLMTAPEAQA